MDEIQKGSFNSAERKWLSEKSLNIKLPTWELKVPNMKVSLLPPSKQQQQHPAKVAYMKVSLPPSSKLSSKVKVQLTPAALVHV